MKDTGMRSTFLALALLAPGLQTSLAHAAEPQVLETPRGISLWLVERHAAPVLSVRFAIPGGAATDPAGQEGLATSTSTLLTEGAGDLDSTAFASRLTDAGIRLSLAALRDRITGSLDVVTARRRDAAELLRLALTRPRIEPQAVARITASQRADVELSERDARQSTLTAWYRHTFAGQSYGRPLQGSAQSLQRITRGDVVDHLPRIIHRSGLKVVIAGDIGRAEAIAFADEAFADVPTNEAAASIAGNPGPSEVPATTQYLAKDLPLASVTFGTRVVTRTPAQRAALQVLSHILGSGDFDCALMQELRVKRGLAYGAATTLVRDATGTLLIGGLSTKPESLDAAIAVLRDTLRATATGGLDDERIEAAKLALSGMQVFDRDGTGKLAATLLAAAMTGEAPDEVASRSKLLASVSADEIRRLAADILRPERFLVVASGQASVPRAMIEAPR